MRSVLYSNLERASTEKGERNDCGVKAVAIAADVSYDVAHAALWVHGRPDNGATPWPALWAALRDCGAVANDITPQRKQWGSVASVVPKLRRNRTYLVCTRRHILCVKGGQVHDWTEGRRHRILRVWQVQ